MQNDLLEEHKSDPSWAEVLRLYSGLFDTQNEREDFILRLAETDILLAAECKMSSVAKEDNLIKNITQKSEKNCLDIDSDKNIINHSLLLIELHEIDKIYDFIKNLNESKSSKEIVSSIIQNCDFDMMFDFIEVLFASKKYELFKHSISLFEKSKINTLYSRRKILRIAGQLFQIDNNLSSSYLLEKITEYLLFPKSIVIEKIKEHLKTKIYRVTVFWIIKYKLDELFSENLILSKIIESKYWNFVFDFIEYSKTLDKKQSSILAITQIMENNGEINEIIKLIRQYNLLGDFNPTKLIYYSIGKNNTIACLEILDMYSIIDIEVVKDAIEYSIRIGKVKIYLELIEYYSLQSVFTLNILFENYSFDFFPQILQKLKQTYKNQDIQKIAVQLVKNYYNSDKLSLCELIISDLNLWTEFDLNNLIKKAFFLKKWGLLVQWYSKYNLQEKYSIEEIINLAIKNNNIQTAYLITKEQKLSFSDFYKIKVGDIVECVITTITVSRLFVKIQYLNIKASIYIGELSNYFVRNIYDFEYSGLKLHKGQNLNAKVISIDKKFGINLSLKRL
jgi:hypothetical protein